MKRRVFIIILALVTVVSMLGLTACSNKTENNPTEDNQTEDNRTEGNQAEDPDVTAIKTAISAADARITQYHQTDAAFADTVMYYLPESCVYDTEEGFLIRYREKNYLYSDSLTESTAEYTFADTVATAPTDVQTVYTLGYAAPYDGGCARYAVSDAAESEVTLERDGKFLNYVSATKKINLRQMGWHGDDLWGYQQQFEQFNSIDTLIFSKGEYPLCDVVRTDRDNVNYFGIEATLYPADNFGGATATRYDSLWSVRKTWSSTHIIEGQRYSGLRFEWRKHSVNNSIDGLKSLSYLMMIAYCHDLAVYKCEYYVPEDLFEDKRANTSHCFDCYSAWHDITIDGCSFEDYAGTYTGGAIGFRDVYNEGCDNLIFTNNTVIAGPRDECVALFAGWDKRNHLDNPVLGKGYIRNCLLENNTFKALDTEAGFEPRVMFLTVGYQLSPVYDIKYLNNTFEGYCNSYFLHYCYCNGLTFKGNTVNIRQTGDTKKMTLIYHNDSPSASDILVEDNTFNLLGDNFHLASITVTSPYSDAEELTFRNNTVNLPEGYADKIIAGDATVKNNVFNMPHIGSIYYRTNGDVGGNTYNIGTMDKYAYEFYNANVKHDLVVKQETINVDVAKSNLIIFNGDNVKFNGHSVLFEDVLFNVSEVDKKTYYLAWDSDKITDTVVPFTFRRCTFGAYDGHLTIANGNKHTISIE